MLAHDLGHGRELRLREDRPCGVVRGVQQQDLAGGESLIDQK